MTLSEIVKNYRAEHGISMDRLANDSNLSKSYISMIENDKNPHTGKSIVPSIDTLAKLAKGMKIDLDTLMYQMGNVPVRIGNVNGNEHILPEDKVLLSYYNKLNRCGKNKVMEYVKDLCGNSNYLKDEVQIDQAELCI